MTELTTGMMAPCVSMLLHNTRKIESGGSYKDLMEAQHLMNELEQKVVEKELRHVALYHQVISTTMFVVSKYATRDHIVSLTEHIHDHQ
jgi:hypothetical protein